MFLLIEMQDDYRGRFKVILRILKFFKEIHVEEDIYQNILHHFVIRWAP